MVVKLLLLLMVNSSYGALLGIVHHVFPIKEKDFELMMQDKLRAIPESEMEKHRKRIIKIARERINRPVSNNLPRTQEYYSYQFDPSVTVNRDYICPTTGKVLIAKGTTANPLDFISVSKPMVFFNGDDVEQVNWAKYQKGLLVLTTGAPFKVSKDIQRQVYFDQHGKLADYFQIEHVPARLSQVNNYILVEEIVV